MCREKTWSVPAPRRPHDAVRHICTKEQEEAGSKGRQNMEKCFMKAKEEPPACMFYGLNAKTTLSIPAAQPVNHSHPYGGRGTSLNSISITYLFKTTVLDLHLSQGSLREVILALLGTRQHLETFLIVPGWEMLLASSGHWPGILWNILQCIREHVYNKGLPGWKCQQCEGSETLI